MVIKIAHRGASGYEPENTIRAFHKAISLDAELIECDVRISKDKKVVIIHDPKINRTTNGKGKVEDLTVEQLQEYDAGKGEKIPTLEEALNAVNRKAKMNIELKAGNTAEPVARIITEFVKYKSWSYDDFFVCSFHHSELKKFYNLLPQVRIGILLHRIPGKIFQLIEELDAFSVNIPLRQINRKVVEKFHERNINVFVWTVDKLKEIKKLKELKVNGIISNFPDRI